MGQRIAWRQVQQLWQLRKAKKSDAERKKGGGATREWRYERAALSESYLYILSLKDFKIMYHFIHEFCRKYILIKNLAQKI